MRIKRKEETDFLVSYTHMAWYDQGKAEHMSSHQLLRAVIPFHSLLCAAIPFYQLLYALRF